ncbi:MAG: outer membrane beta-barrel protein [Rickettsiaceae bacterium]|nr:outer membrane beta-barrel protein [Rickettsiaceae bacterium]
MKKLLLTTAILAIANSASAEVGGFYVRGDLGASALPTRKISTQDYFFDYDVKLSGKLKSSTQFTGSIGVGTYVTDMFRTELVLSGHTNATQKANLKTTIDGVDVSKNMPISQTRKVRILDLSIKGIADVYDFGAGKVFLGAGVGVSRVSGSVKTKVSSPFISAEEKFKYKTKNNFSYLLTAGSSFNVSEGVNVDVAYTYKNHGKLSKIKGHDGKLNYSISTHSLTAGVRVDL